VDGPDQPGHGRGEEAVAGDRVPQPEVPPAPPVPTKPPLPAWLDRVDYRVRLYAERLPEHEIAPYLKRIAGFYGIDTS
jgi:hypothetical protein